MAKREVCRDFSNQLGTIRLSLILAKKNYVIDGGSFLEKDHVVI
jgi:hypothetical protein